ncbi:hypothetical protein V1502_15465 [Bacillus sp. SCS-153A]|uniref:hypothetical protein n=1 Tax=Rossellomorea sedimentorum TaxID=3115294 RepID=UPI00390683E6
MELYVFALIAFVILLPVLFFLPGGIARIGKVWIAGGGLLISLLGLLALNQYSLWMVAIFLFILVIVSSLVIGNRFGPQILAEGEAQDNESSSAVADTTEKDEKIFFAAVDEEESVIDNSSRGTAEFKEEENLLNLDWEPEKDEDTQVEFIPNEELEEIPILSETDDSDNDSQDPIDLEDVEASEDTDLTEEVILEEVMYENTPDVELSEIEWLIQQEEQEDTEPVHNLENVEALSDSEESIEDASIINAHEEAEDMEDEMEPLSEIEWMISQAETEQASHENVLSEDPQEKEDSVQDGELPPFELSADELSFLESGNAGIDEESEEEVDLSAEESLEADSDQDEDHSFGVELSERPEILQEEPELLSDTFEEEEEKLDELESSELDEGISDELTEVSDQETQDEIHPGTEESGQELDMRPPLQTLVIHTIVEELAYFKNKLSLAEFEALTKQYLHPELHDRDYYVLSQQLIQRYNELKEYKKLKLFIDEIEDRFSSYPILKSELNDYKEIAWMNMIKE